MGLVLAAVGAAVAALLESTIVPRVQIAGAELEILLVFAVVLTLLVSFEDGMAWAFVGGLATDLMTIRPLGSTVFALLVVVGLAAVASRALSRSRLVGPVIATLVLTVVYLAATQTLMTMLHYSSAPLRPSWLIPVAIVNAALAAVITPPFVLWKRRSEERERVTW